MLTSLGMFTAGQHTAATCFLGFFFWRGRIVQEAIRCAGRAEGFLKFCSKLWFEFARNYMASLTWSQSTFLKSQSSM